MRPVRTTMIVAFAFGVGDVAGVLTYLNGHSVPQAMLAAGTAAGSAAQLLIQVLGRGAERPSSPSDDATHGGEPRSNVS
jgi:hypothetical protein